MARSLASWGNGERYPLLEMQGGTVCFFGNEIFPGGVVFCDHALDVARSFPQECFIEEGDVYNKIVGEEVLVEVLVLFRGAESTGRDKFSGFSVKPRGNVEACLVLESTSEGFENTAGNISRPFFLKQFIEKADGKRNGDGLPREMA